MQPPSQRHGEAPRSLSFNIHARICRNENPGELPGFILNETENRLSQFQRLRELEADG
jgi:hypothetical protein